MEDSDSVAPFQEAGDSRSFGSYRRRTRRNARIRFWVATAVLGVGVMVLAHALTMDVGVQTPMGQVEHSDLVNLRIVLACAGALLSTAAGFVMAEARRTVMNNTVTRKSYDTEMPSSSWSGSESQLAHDDGATGVASGIEADARVPARDAHG